MATDGVPENDTPEGEKPDPDAAARLRAALGFADINDLEFAEALGKSDRQVRRYKDGDTRISEDVWAALLRHERAAGLPRWFIDHGFNPPPASDEPGLAEKVEKLDNEMQTVLAILRGRALVAAAEGTKPPTAPSTLEDAEKKDP